jgi:hypothetical protein
MCAYRDPHGATYTYAACDLSLRTLSIEEALLPEIDNARLSRPARHNLQLRRVRPSAAHIID